MIVKIIPLLLMGLLSRATGTDEARVRFENISFKDGIPMTIQLVVMVPKSWKEFPEHVLLTKSGDLIKIGRTGEHLADSADADEFRMIVDIREHEGHGLLRGDVEWKFEKGISGGYLMKSKGGFIPLVNIDGYLVGLAVGELDLDNVVKSLREDNAQDAQ